MAINSFEFVCSVLVILFIYFVLQNTKFQKYVLLCANAYFVYAFSGEKGLIIAAVIVGIVYFCGMRIENSISCKKKKVAYLWLMIGGILDIGILLFFKYYAAAWNCLKGIFNHDTELFYIAAPVGLAYFSLSLLGYLLDIYHKKIKAEKNYINLAVFALYFPAIIEGPFGFYRKLSSQVIDGHKFDWDRMVLGLQRVLWGYFKKLVIADRIGILVNGILGNEESWGCMIFVAMVFYSFQIYADFSGGIDVIMGISEIMGISLHENFNSPLISRSVTEYWQRWHMSLGEWMEKYLYYPIVLNKKMLGVSKKIKNNYLSKAFSATVASIIVFVIVGIWHGTGWNYVVYGAYQAFWVSTAILFKPIYSRMKAFFRIQEDDFGWEVFQIIRTFIILVFGRYLIKASSLGQAIYLLKKTFAVWDPVFFFNGLIYKFGLDIKNYYLMIASIVLLVIVDVCHNRGIHFREKLMNTNIIFRYTIYMVAIFMIVIMGIYGKGYDASSFIYAGF